MAIFSKFGVWENEVKEFINKVSVETKLPEKALTDWFYSEGIIIFQKAQSSSYHGDVKVCQEKYGHRPIISSTYMLGQKFIGFMALLPKLVEKFANADVTLQRIITNFFNSFVANAVNRHIPFYGIQADITTDLNYFLDQNPSTPNDDIFKYIVEKFSKLKDDKPTLSQEIDDHLLLMKEFADYMTKQQKSVLQTTSSGSPVMFKASPAAAEMKVDPAKANTIPAGVKGMSLGADV